MNRIDADHKETDSLAEAFKRLPEEELPASFRENVMRQVLLEAERARKRAERSNLVALILALLALLALTVATFIYIELPRFSLPRLDVSAFAFYGYIGAAALLLLFADYKLRNRSQKRRPLTK